MNEGGISMGYDIDNETQTSGLSRREFLAGAAAAGAAAAALSSAEAEATNDRKNRSSERIVVDGLEASAMTAPFLDLLQQAGVDCVNPGFGPDVYGFVYENSNRAVIAKSAADIRRAKADGKISVVMGQQEAKSLEDAAYGNNNYPLGSFKQMVQVLRQYKGMGLGVQGICYNATNIFGSGCLDHSVPLTRAGRRLVDAIHDNRIILDVGGHTGERTSLDAIAITKGVPVVCTHTNFAALNPNPRAVSDRLAEAIAATGGIIGITAVSPFHTRNASNVKDPPRQATLQQHLDQYDYAKRLIGVDHIGLGPDFIFGSVDTLQMDPEDSVAFPPETMAPGIQTTVEGFENISKLSNLIRGLKERGWTEAELDKLLGANWLRVYEQVWGA
jgi:membrane dipeptidase